MKKKAMVTIQQKTTGQLGSRRCKDSDVAQQLIPISAKKVMSSTNFLIGRCSITICYLVYYYQSFALVEVNRGSLG